MSVISTRKLNWLYGRSRSVAMGCLLFRVLESGRSGRDVEGLLSDAEDHELGRPQRGDTDEADEAAVVEVVLGHRRSVAPDEERLLWNRPEQVAVGEFVEEEVLHSAAHVVPESLAVGLEHGPLGP